MKPSDHDLPSPSLKDMRSFLLRISLMLLFGAAGASQASAAGAIQLISTSEHSRWVGQVIGPLKADGDTAADLTIELGAPEQRIRGFGGTFNELGWDALQAVSPAERAAVLRALFGAEGAAFTLARTPVGASDYALSYYSYCDVKGDFPMRDFSIARDRYILIPYIREAFAIRPDLQLWASPWTPPAWMKINEHYTQRAGDLDGRTGGNAMDPRQDIPGTSTGFNMQAGYLQAYARYLRRYVEAYASEGIQLWALMPQNEILYSPNWPCCTWQASDLAHFIGQYLGPEFERAGLGTELWLGTINSPDPSYVRTVLQDAAAARHLRGIGLQWNGGKAIAALHAEFPERELMQTENPCGNGENNWSSMEATWRTMHHYFTQGAGSYLYWNMVLDETGRSSWGWSQNSLVVIDRTAGTVRYTDEFLLMKHVSHFVPPGSLRLRTTGAESLAFQTPAGDIVLVVYRADESDQATRVALGGRVLIAPVRARSLHTLLVPAALLETP